MAIQLLCTVLIKMISLLLILNTKARLMFEKQALKQLFFSEKRKSCLTDRIILLSKYLCHN